MAITLEKLNNEIKDYIPTKKFILEAEVSGVSIRRGHCYFDFKDKTNKLPGTIWNCKKYQLQIEDGDKIKCTGRLSFYPPLGKLSFNLDEIISKTGVGDVHQDFLILKDKLKKEGIFDKPKKKITSLIKKVIILTSNEGAAIQDILKNLKNHNSNIDVQIEDVPVQGIYCHKEISKKIDSFNKYKNLIIILTRGGGDYQDLNGFNQEEIIRSVYNSNNIIFSAIGHETDTVLTDYVADYSLPTPSLVAQFLIDHNNNFIDNYYDTLLQFKQNLVDELDKKITNLNYFEKQIIHYEYEINSWLNLQLQNIKNDIDSKIRILEQWFYDLDNLGEISLLTKDYKPMNSLEDFGLLFIDNKFHLKIKDDIFEISDFKINKI